MDAWNAAQRSAGDRWRNPRIFARDCHVAARKLLFTDYRPYRPNEPDEA